MDKPVDWFEDEDFWRECYPMMFPPERFAASDEQVEQALSLAKPLGRAALDLCCGPGRHSCALAQRGFAVTGVDRSAFLLQHARERAAGMGVEVEWVNEDMRRFRRPAAFDLACSMFTSFGYFTSDAEELQVLRNVAESLRPGGVFVMELLGKERLARVYQDAHCIDLPDGSSMLQRHQILDDWTRVRNEWTLIKDGRCRTFRFEHFVYSGRELKDRLLASGFESVQLFGDLAGAPYGIEAMRLVAVARKAG
jgi:SAM-dependent methyltransferase